MPTFRYTALDAAGNTCHGTVEATDAGAAANILRSRGWFVVKLAIEGADRWDTGDRRESLAADAGQPKLFWLLVAGSGLAMSIVGLWGAIDALRFDLWGKRIDATVVRVERDHRVGWLHRLEIPDGGKVFQDDARGAFGLRWSGGESPESRRVAVLRQPGTKHVRLAAFGPRYRIPLMLLALGLTLTPAGLLGFSNHYSPWLHHSLILMFLIASTCGMVLVALWLLRIW